MSDPEQESYSIDEMLSRLRSRKPSADQHGDGPQLVTRADGTQAIRVRRRKRRTHQPHKEAEARRRRRNLVVATLVIGLLVSLAVALLGWFFHLNSKSYQDDLKEEIEAWTGAEIELTRFRATPVSVGAEAIYATWPESSPAASLKLQILRGDLKATSHLGGNWTGQELRAAVGELVLRAAPEAGGGGLELPEGELPFRLPIKVAALNVRFGEKEQTPLGLWRSSASFVVPDPAVHAGSVVLEGGSFRLNGWGSFNLEFASIHLKSSGVRVGNMVFSPETAPDAKIRLTGEDLPDLLVHGGPSELRVGLKDVPAVHLLGAGLSRLVDARFETSDEDRSASVCSFDLTDASSVRVAVPLRTVLGSRFQLRHLPCLAAIGNELGNPRLAQPSFESQVRATVRRDSGGCRLEGFQLVSHDEVHISGHLGDRGGKLDGLLEIGLPEATVTSSPALEQVFKRAASGMRWTTVRVGGSTRAPTDDLGARLDAARLQVAPGDEGEHGLEQEFMELTTPGNER